MKPIFLLAFAGALLGVLVAHEIESWRRRRFEREMIRRWEVYSSDPDAITRPMVQP